MAQLIILLLSCLLSLPEWAMATVYYVAAPDSPSGAGNNSNNGTSIETPKRTVTHCVSIMQAGDTCYVRGGTYTTEGFIRFTRSGTSSAPIKLLNYPGERPIIDWGGDGTLASVTSDDTIFIYHGSGQNVPMGYITIEGFEIRNGYNFKFYSMHNSVIRRNWVHNMVSQGILGGGGHHNTFDRNIISHNGNFIGCAEGDTTSDGFSVCNQSHGLYVHGDSYTITNNLIYDNLAYGIVQNGSPTSTFNASKHPDASFAGARNWIVANNTFAYNNYRAGVVIWGSLTGNARYENNIFYQNGQSITGVQGIAFTSATGTGTTIRNNHAYATTPGATGFYGGTGPTEGVHFTQSGNVVNVSSPAFVNAPSTLPGSPDFRLTASAPVNIARTNEFPNNLTGVVGAFKTVANCTATITANIITITCPMNTAVPIQVESIAGLSVSCTGSACPGSPTVSAASRKSGADSQAEVIVSGIAGNACVAANQTWRLVATSALTWTGFDDIGPFPGLHQKILPFDIAVTNLCDGSGPPSGPGTPHIDYAMDDGSGTTVTDSSGNDLHMTLVNGASWGPGKTGTGVVVTGGTQQGQIPYGSGVDPSTQSMTWVVAINVPTGQENTTQFVFGADVGTDQRSAIAAVGGTWRATRQGAASAAVGASNLAVTSGWNFLCERWDSTTDTVTLWKGDVQGTGGAAGSYTSFTLPGNLEMPLVGSGFPATVTPATFDDVRVFTSLEDCAALYAAWNAPPPIVGTFSQIATRFQAVHFYDGSPLNFGTAINQEQQVVANGGWAVLIEVHCDAGADCDQDAFRLESRRNGAGAWTQVPDTLGIENIAMWGTDSSVHLNSGITTSRISATSCTVTNGVTRLTASQVPVFDLPEGGCVVIRYIGRVGSNVGDFYDLRLVTQNGTIFGGSYQLARLRVVRPMASAGF